MIVVVVLAGVFVAAVVAELELRFRRRRQAAAHARAVAMSRAWFDPEFARVIAGYDREDSQ